MGRHVGSMQPPVTFKWILALSVVGLLIWACFFSARSSVVTTKTKEIKSTAAGQTVSSESVDEPVLQTVPTAFKSPECTYDLFTYPEWPDNFNVSVNALFLIGQQKSGSTWLWELLRGHPCLISAAQPHWRMGAITTKETYYFTYPRVRTDAREFLIPWMGFDRNKAVSDDAEESIGDDWFEHALKAANVGIASDDQQYGRQRSYTGPNAKLKMKACKQYFLLEATPHNINSPVVAKRMKKLFPESKAVAILKEPAFRMHSAYNQFKKPYLNQCRPNKMAPWCPVYRYYQLRLPTFAEVAQQDLEYMRGIGCSFEGETNARSWMSCFGCTAMNPWKHKRDNINLEFHPFMPSTALSMYEPMLKEWTQWFPMEDLRVINYHDLVESQLDIVNNVLRFVGLEEFTQAHMDILSPKRLGFKGVYDNASDQTDFEGKDVIQQFFKPHNARLDQFLSGHPIPWHPFKTDV